MGNIAHQHHINVHALCQCSSVLSAVGWIVLSAWDYVPAVRCHVVGVQAC